MKAINDVLRFTLELGLLSSLAYWGGTEGEGVWAWVLGLAAPAIAATVWGLFLAPKASRRVHDPWRLVFELALFGAAVAALAAADQPMWAVVFGGLVALHLALTFVLGQREPEQLAR